MGKTPTEPTGEQCTQHSLVYEDEYDIGYACWYPQMGGYAGKAVAVMDRKWSETSDGSGASGGCIEVYVWHDGEFPFRGEGTYPVRIHHCDPEQFIQFGKLLSELNNKNKIIEG